MAKATRTTLSLSSLLPGYIHPKPLVRLAEPSMLQGTATDTKKRKNFAEIAQATFGDKARLMVCPRSDSCG